MTLIILVYQYLKKSVRIRSIISKKSYKNNFNCIIILKKSVLECSYKELEDELLDNMKKVIK